MIRKYVRYRVASDYVDQTLAIIDTFVQAIGAHEPETDYIAYQAADPQNFMHTMAFVDAAAEKAHQTAAYTEAFVAALYPHCEELPVFVDITRVATAKNG